MRSARRDDDVGQRDYIVNFSMATPAIPGFVPPPG
jgi:hypothetical protein